ncbi:MAG: hypothetical protein ACD_12C00264G0001 [uncultured bacterium]|nr:MAG: hypothetical protein ACD_12C00264G0001 [uncultured bacterium]
MAASASFARTIALFKAEIAAFRSLILECMAGSFSSLYFSVFFLITSSSSACNTNSLSLSENIFFKTSSSSTSRLPVEEPIKIFIPATSLTFLISSKLSKVAPK